MEPLYVINFKAYPQGIGKRAIELAKTLDEVAGETGEKIIIAVQPTDIARIVDKVEIPVFAQHVDPITPGPHTGSIPMEAIIEAGASGTLLNHSEKRLRVCDVAGVVRRAREMGIKTIVCAGDEYEAGAISRLKPDYVAIEPPELIGGNVSVSRAKPEVISRGLRAVSPVPLLVGAGVKTCEDVKKAIELGASGVLVASGIVKAENPRNAMLKLIGRM